MIYRTNVHNCYRPRTKNVMIVRKNSDMQTEYLMGYPVPFFHPENSDIRHPRLFNPWTADSIVSELNEFGISSTLEIDTSENPFDEWYKEYNFRNREKSSSPQIFPAFKGRI